MPRTTTTCRRALRHVAVFLTRAPDVATRPWRTATPPFQGVATRTPGAGAYLERLRGLFARPT